MHLTFHSTPTWTLKGRVDLVTKSNQNGLYPGPFQYSSERKTQRGPTFVIGKESREVFKVKETNPGPGSYQLKSHIDSGVKRTIGAKLDHDIKNSPGPADYNAQLLKVKRKEPHFSISKRSKSFKDIVKDNNLYQPPPTAYDSKGSFNNPKGIFGKSNRRDLSQYEQTPGPAAYLTIDLLNRNKSLSSVVNPRCAIGTSPRKTDIIPLLDNPGPGTYQKVAFCDQNKSNKKGYTLRIQTTDLIASQRAKVPGPGAYDINLKTKPKAPEYGSGSTKRTTFIDQAKKQHSQIPPPGIHDSKSDWKYKTSNSFKFGNSNRKPLDENELTPGPGNYNQNKGRVMSEAPKFSVGKSNIRLDEYLKKEEVPAPNVYDPKLDLVKPTVKVSDVPHQQRPNFDKEKKLPGPGYYNIRGKAEGPTWKFGSQERRPFTEQKEPAKLPGVGQYTVESSFPNPPTYMGGKRK